MIDVKSAFLQTRQAEHSVYVVPPSECAERKFYCVLLTEAYGLVNASAKWQKQFDDLLNSLNLQQGTAIPQLFYLTVDGHLVLILVKFIDDMIFAGEQRYADIIFTAFSSRFKLGRIIHGPGQVRCFDLNVIQQKDYTCSIEGVDKPSALELYPLSRFRRKQAKCNMNMVERSMFMSLHASLRWLGVIASCFCSFFSSHSQQELPDGCVFALLSKTNALC